MSHDDHVHVSGLGGLNAVKDHGGGVRSLVLADEVRPAALGPDLQLVRGGSPEGVSPRTSRTFFPAST